MQTYKVRLSCEPSNSFRCKRAADSLDIDIEKKVKHNFKVECDLQSDYRIGLIVGASGSGKTTLAHSIFGEGCFWAHLDLEKPVIEQFPKSMSYEQCANSLMGIGLTSVPCWIRPAKTLSNGQKNRAEIALAMCKDLEIICIDEWTSVVDRTVAKIMSHCVQKFARKNQRKIVLCSCHYDVIEWLDPDWIIDCNKQKFIDRRSLCRLDRKRKESLDFTIQEIGPGSWSYFSKFHYLSESLPRGRVFFYGLFHGEEQVGFQCFASYCIGQKVQDILHSNRVVIHPDYVGFGLGLRLVNACSEIIMAKGYRVFAKFSSIPMLKSRLKDNRWKFRGQEVKFKSPNVKGTRKTGFRLAVKTYSFEFIG